MFIDDDEATNYYHQYIINKVDCCDQYLIFESSDDALDYLDTQSKLNNPPELIFLDLNMPKMDGWMFLKEYENRVSKKSIIVILTSSTNPKDKQLAEENPLVFAIETKPLVRTKILELVELIAKQYSPTTDHSTE